jgi:hypothetical protein
MRAPDSERDEAIQAARSGLPLLTIGPLAPVLIVRDHNMICVGRSVVLDATPPASRRRWHAGRVATLARAARRRGTRERQVARSSCLGLLFPGLLQPCTANLDLRSPHLLL